MSTNFLDKFRALEIQAIREQVIYQLNNKNDLCMMMKTLIIFVIRLSMLKVGS